MVTVTGIWYLYDGEAWRTPPNPETKDGVSLHIPPPRVTQRTVPLAESLARRSDRIRRKQLGNPRLRDFLEEVHIMDTHMHTHTHTCERTHTRTSGGVIPEPRETKETGHPRAACGLGWVLGWGLGGAVKGTSGTPGDMCMWTAH